MTLEADSRVTSDRAQPWKEWLDKEKEEKEKDPEKASQKPWLTWQPTPEDPSIKPWLTWNPNIDNGDVDPNKKIIKTHVMGGCPSSAKQQG
ncbi:hypothetical protein BU26DRAFT_561097 [Trematosphaeria pertusa]|uniref:Uncharacterized protein n=1 Tax=Trematosphaeria pertusa TaxID=390896 RepID=A0A6A6IUM5_9PLEO|nr:uncharacterized protein BU26DRAFT_561097 [Trematosphaeria pertusa]KAF2253827.1 hypothetical protein BU26DRAFT_561097 [Trematosphaeria pertusa]